MLVRSALVFTLVLAGCQPGDETRNASAQDAPTLASDDDKAFYALGLEIAHSLQSFAITDDELERVVLGLRDGATGEPEKIEDRRRFAQRA